MTLQRLSTALAVCLLFGLLAACAKPPVNRDESAPLEVVSSVDLDRYLGRWYEIARFPNSFEEDCEGVTADYSRREDGLIKVVNTCRKGGVDGPEDVAEGRARVVDEATNAKLEVSFFGPFWGDYWIIDLGPDYAYSVVSEPEGRYLWILSRTPTLEEETLTGITARLADRGYNIDALYYTEQPPAP